MPLASQLPPIDVCSLRGEQWESLYRQPLDCVEMLAMNDIQVRTWAHFGHDLGGRLTVPGPAL